MEKSLIVIERLREYLQQQLNMTAIAEPNNAISRRAVRITPTSTALSKLPNNDGNGNFTPYELLLGVQITLKLSGANAGDYLTSQIIEHGIGLQCFLWDDLIILKDVTQDLPLLDNDKAGLFTGTRIVGDAELTDPKRIGSNIENNAQNDKPGNDLFFYTEIWSATLVMTVHRFFVNPRLSAVIYTNTATNEEIVVNAESVSSH